MILYMELIYFWTGIIVIFIILELLTSTFYGLSLALAAGVVSLYVFFSKELELSLVQGLIFVVASAIFAYFLPKYLFSSMPDVPQGADKYIGEKRSVKKIAGDLKISLDGVEYLIDAEDEIVAGDKVEVLWHKGVSMKVKKV